MRFPEWARQQPRGALKRIERDHGVGYNTLARLMRGETLANYTVAKKISDATDGAVTVAEICEAEPTHPAPLAAGARR
jgi:hypothetical protein